MQIMKMMTLRNLTSGLCRSCGAGCEIGQCRVKVTRGNAFAQPATPKSRFEIRTPKAITAVRGTEWSILATILQSDVLVLSGRMGVRKNEISGASAISLTRTLGVTVTDQDLGKITRSTEAQVAALMSATEVPGPEMQFDLDKTPGLNLEPIKAPDAPKDQRQEKSKKRRTCYDIEDLSCSKSGKDGTDSAGHGTEGRPVKRT